MVWRRCLSTFRKPTEQRSHVSKPRRAGVLHCLSRTSLPKGYVNTRRDHTRNGNISVGQAADDAKPENKGAAGKKKKSFPKPILRITLLAATPMPTLSTKSQTVPLRSHKKTANIDECSPPRRLNTKAPIVLFGIFSESMASGIAYYQDVLVLFHKKTDIWQALSTTKNPVFPLIFGHFAKIFVLFQIYYRRDKQKCPSFFSQILPFLGISLNLWDLVQRTTKTFSFFSTKTPISGKPCQRQEPSFSP